MPSAPIGPCRTQSISEQTSSEYAAGSSGISPAISSACACRIFTILAAFSLSSSANASARAF